jgi:predicted deacylase
MRHVIPRILAITAAGLLAACAVKPLAEAPYTEDRYCASESYLADAHFEGGKLGRCVVADDGVFELTNYPEDPPPINVSPWYAFRVSGRPGEEAVVRIGFEHGFARYWPKISSDGVTWERLDPQRVDISADGSRMEIRLALDGPQVWVAGQEPLTTQFYEAWVRDLAALHHVDVALAGHSVEGRPIFLAETADRREVVLLLGRQHPPEVSGAFAMQPFVRAVLADTELAVQFRRRYKLVILPLLNPDGVVAGHWRHNVNGVDLNRDWGPFSQPETQLVRDWLARADGRGMQVRLMLDFHSTDKNVFYTQRDGDLAHLRGFTARWLEAASRRLPEYGFVREAQETSDQANSKNYFYSRYGIPAITYETGDETPRDGIGPSAVVFAEEMMRLMLSYPPGTEDTGSTAEAPAKP